MGSGGKDAKCARASSRRGKLLPGRTGKEGIAYPVNERIYRAGAAPGPVATPLPSQMQEAASTFYPIGTPGQPWVAAERDQWRARQVRQRSYADDVLTAIEALRGRFDVELYGDVVYADAHHPAERFPLRALRSRDWQPGLPSVLVTGGVHGYETSGVHGALHFADTHAERFAGRANLLVVPCVSPWAYERFQRWNFDAIDPNRSFREGSPAQESAALMRLVAQHQAQYGPFAAHIDLHETTDTDARCSSPAASLTASIWWMTPTTPNPPFSKPSSTPCAASRILRRRMRRAKSSARRWWPRA
jgi:hypothetical protein